MKSSNTSPIKATGEKPIYIKPASPLWTRVRRLAMAAFAGIAVNVQAQTIVHVGGEGGIGDTVLTTAADVALVPNSGAYWAAAGGEGTFYSNLTSRALTVTADGMVTLKFKHRYDFEKNFDGGAVYISVDGAAPIQVPGTAFTSNGYNATGLIGSVFTDGEDVFSGASTGWETAAQIESVGTLGPFSAGQTLAIQFRGGWDAGWVEPAPGWEIGSVDVRDAADTAMLSVDFQLGAAGFTVVSGEGLTGPWAYAGTETCQFELDAASASADRFTASTPGVIDLNYARLKVLVLNGTLSAGQTFSLFNLSGGSTLQGKYSSLELPEGYWDVSGLQAGGNGQIRVLAGTTWTGLSADPGDDLWSSASNWSVAPEAGMVLQFGASTRTAPNNDLAAATSFGRIWFAAGAPAYTLGGNEITLAGDIINNSSSKQIIQLPLALSAAIEVNTGARDLTLGGVISGTGTGLTKTGGGALNLSAANTYDGGTTLSAGSLTLGVGTSTTAALGTGPVTVSSGTYLGGPGPGATATVANDNSFTLTGDCTFGDFNSGTGPITINAPLAITIGNSVTIGGVVSGPDGLNALDIQCKVHDGWGFGPTLAGAITLRDNQTVTGHGATLSGAIDDGGNGYGLNIAVTSGWGGWGGYVSLSGVNTYTGDTVVTSGILAVKGSSIIDSGRLVISGGKVAPTGTETVDTLFFGATQQIAGTWGATGSGAEHIDDARFTGTAGMVLVITNPVANILTFELPGNPALIVDTNITLYVPNGTDVTNLAPAYTMSEGATGDKPSGSTQNFASPVSYTITSGSITKKYRVTVVIAPVETSVVWNAGGSGAWNTSAPNWLGQDSGLPSPFSNGQHAIFNQTAGGTITIAPDMAPASTTVSAASGTYVFNGGPLIAGSLTKSGGGTLQLAAANTYEGGTTLRGGSLTLGVGTSTTAALGTGALTIESGTYLGGPGPGAVATLAHNNAIVINGNCSFGDLNTGTGPVTISAPVQITIGNSVIIGGVVSGPDGLNALDIQCKVHDGAAFGPTLAGAITLRDNQVVTGNGSVISGVIGDGGNGYGLTISTPAGWGGWGGYISLRGINTYTGDTILSQGRLELFDNASLKFMIGANGVNNKISGTGTAALNGDFDIDLSGAAMENGNRWTLVDVDTLTETFGSTFTVTGWTENSNEWTLVVGDRIWTFSEATGALTYSGSDVSNPYADWTARFPGFTDRAPARDPDGDGMNNFQEFSFGLNPTSGTSRNPITTPLNKTTHKFSYTRLAASGLNYTVWTSTNLQAWDGPVAMTENVGTPDSNGVVAVEVTLTSPPAPNKLFVRVQAE